MSGISQYSLNWVDWSIIAVITLSVVISFFRGFLREIISLVVWVVGFLVALKYATTLQNYLSPWIHSELVRYIICFVGLFVIVLLVGILINMVVHMLVSKTGLGLTDRFLGLFFGAARGLLVVSVMLMFFSVGTSRSGSSINNSKLAHYFSPAVDWLKSNLPEEVTHVSRWVKPGGLEDTHARNSLPRENS